MRFFLESGKFFSFPPGWDFFFRSGCPLPCGQLFFFRPSTAHFQRFSRQGVDVPVPSCFTPDPQIMIDSFFLVPPTLHPFAKMHFSFLFHRPTAYEDISTFNSAQTLHPFTSFFTKGRGLSVFFEPSDYGGYKTLG